MHVKSAALLGGSLIVACLILGSTLPTTHGAGDDPPAAGGAQVGRFDIQIMPPASPGVGPLQPGRAFLFDTSTGQVWEATDADFHKPKVKSLH